jgi:hypothetical protein
MNIIQAFRRIGQISGWGHSIAMQSAQLPLIQKLYARNDLEIKLTSYACPEQYEVFRNDRQVAYYRLRHGEFRVDYPECGGEEILCEHPNGDGIFDENERLIYLAKAMRKVLEKLNTEQ